MPQTGEVTKSSDMMRKALLQHRIVYEVLDSSKTVYVLRMWTHYE